MDIDIRSHIINNFKDDDINTLRNAISGSIKEKDEIALPGLGIFLEILWENASEELKEEILDIIYKEIKK